MWLYLALHTQVHASYNLSNYFNLVTLLWCYPTILFLNPWKNKVIPGRKKTLKSPDCMNKFMLLKLLLLTHTPITKTPNRTSFFFCH